MGRRLVLAAAVAILLAGRAAVAECRKPVATITPLASAGERLLVPVTLDGAPTVFELDTGADLSLISEALATRLGLRRAVAPRPLLAGADGHPLSAYAMADSLLLGGLSRGPMRFVLVPHWQVVDARATGMLGGDLVDELDLDLDLAQPAVTLYPAESCPGGRPPWPGRSAALEVTDGHAIVTVTLDGHRLQALIDTGASHSSLSLTLAARLFGLRPGGAGMAAGSGTITTDGGRLATWRHRFAALGLAGISLPSPTVDLIERADNPHLASDHDMVLGLAELRRLHLYLAYRQRRLFVAVAP